jgi:hypothetical protein
VAYACEHGNETCGSIIDGKFLDLLKMEATRCFETLINVYVSRLHGLVTHS